MIMNEPDPSKCKKLGKQVKNLDIAAWGRCKEEIVYHANLAKFSQNKKTQYYLLSTGESTGKSSHTHSRGTEKPKIIHFTGGQSLERIDHSKAYRNRTF